MQIASVLSLILKHKSFVGLAYQSMFRLIIEYTSLRDFGP
jgi:hypothetical protein